MNIENRPIAGMAELCAAFVELDDACGDATGGAGRAHKALFALEDYLVASLSSDPAVIAWKSRWLARAVTNGWDDDLVEPLAAAVVRDVGLTRIGGERVAG